MDGDVKIFPDRRIGGASMAPCWRQGNLGLMVAPSWRRSGATRLVYLQMAISGAKLAPRPVHPHLKAVLRGFRRISVLGNG